jgi:hypothetical protein
MRQSRFEGGTLRLKPSCFECFHLVVLFTGGFHREGLLPFLITSLMGLGCVAFSFPVSATAAR